MRDYSLELVATEAGANVWMLEPYDTVVFEKTRSLPFLRAPGRLTVTAAVPSQIAADLMTSPGGSQEAEARLAKGRIAGGLVHQVRGRLPIL